MCRILLVDDEALVLTLLKRVLHDAGHETVAVSSGEEAIAIAETEIERMDLLITDLKMTGISGQETAARIRQLKPDLPVIYMSGYCDRAAAGLNALAGSSQFLAKPFTKHSLLNAIHMVLPEQCWMDQQARAINA